jgi:hypothetical protein
LYEIPNIFRAFSCDVLGLLVFPTLLFLLRSIYFSWFNRPT